MLKVKKLRELLAELPDEMEVEGVYYYKFIYRQRPKLSDSLSLCFGLNGGSLSSLDDTSPEGIKKVFLSEREGAKVKITAHLRSETEKLAKSEANIKRNKELAEAQLEEILKEGE